MTLLGEEPSEGGLMAAVRWSRPAVDRLESISPAMRDRLVGSAEKVLHDIRSDDFPQDEGCAGEIMWHRGIQCGMPSEELLAQEDDDGPWNYFLFYRALPPEAAAQDPNLVFEVLHVCGVDELARRWLAGGWGPPGPSR
jgi:hypothetical protein